MLSNEILRLFDWFVGFFMGKIALISYY